MATYNRPISVELINLNLWQVELLPLCIYPAIFTFALLYSWISGTSFGFQEFGLLGCLNSFRNLNANIIQ